MEQFKYDANGTSLFNLYLLTFSNNHEYDDQGIYLYLIPCI